MDALWKKGFGWAVILFALAPAAASLAEDAPFTRVYTVDTAPKGHFEAEQLVRNRTGRAFGSYSAFDFKSEVEYGVTDNFQPAFYVNTGAINAKGAPDDDDPNASTGFSRSRFFMQSLALEFIYRVLDPDKDPFGLAFYFEPEILLHDRHNGLAYDGSWETEYKILFEKDFLQDHLILAFNTIAETEWIRFKGEQAWSDELEWNNEIGLSYRLPKGWFAGIEGRNQNELDHFQTHANSAYWVGPTISHSGKKSWIALGVLRQVYGVPTGTDSNGTLVGSDHLYLRSHEKWETTLKIGVPF